MSARSVTVALFFGLLLCGRPELASANESVCMRIARAGSAGTRLVYVKAEHALCLLEGAELVWEGQASHGRGRGKKQFEGDGRTPEGHYTVAPARVSERFGLFMQISYPNDNDTRAARALGKKPGGGIGIHGPQQWYAFLGRAQSLFDHSDGCIVLDEKGMRELTERVRKSIPIEISVAAPQTKS